MYIRRYTCLYCLRDRQSKYLHFVDYVVVAYSFQVPLTRIVHVISEIHKELGFLGQMSLKCLLSANFRYCNLKFAIFFVLYLILR